MKQYQTRILHDIVNCLKKSSHGARYVRELPVQVDRQLQFLLEEREEVRLFVRHQVLQPSHTRGIRVICSG